MWSYIGQDQSLGPNSPPVVAPPGRPCTPESWPPRPLPLPPAPAPPPEAPTGRALPQRLHTPRNAKFTFVQLLGQHNIRSHLNNSQCLEDEDHEKKKQEGAAHQSHITDLVFGHIQSPSCCHAFPEASP